MGAFHVKLSPEVLAKVAGVESLDASIAERVREFAALLAEANRKINLVSRAKDVSTEIDRQVLISLAASALIHRLGPIHTCLDVGSGGGFPAIPLAILHPKIRFTLIESTAKKAFFLERTAQKLELANVSVINERFEGFPTLPCDLFTLKAVADISTAFVWAAKTLSHNGSFLTFRPFPIDRDWQLAAHESGFEQIETLHLKTSLDIDNLEIVAFRKAR